MRTVAEARKENKRRKKELANAEHILFARAAWMVAYHVDGDQDCGVPTWEFVAGMTEAIEQYNEAEYGAYFECPCCGDANLGIWMVHDDLWKSTGLKHDDGLWCRSCFEKLIGRALTVEDLTEAPCNDELRTKLNHDNVTTVRKSA